MSLAAGHPSASKESERMTTLFGLLTLLPWVLASGLILLIALIARFYQVKYAELHVDAPVQRTHYMLFAVPVSAFLIAAARYAWMGDFAGDLFADILTLCGGIALGTLALRLQHLMTGGRR
jgi:magnesium-transporting ATPase (P-type)